MGQSPWELNRKTLIEIQMRDLSELCYEASLGRQTLFVTPEGKALKVKMARTRWRRLLELVSRCHVELLAEQKKERA